MMFINPSLLYIQEAIRYTEICKNFVSCQDRQKSYVDNRRRPLEFNIEDKVLLKVAPWKHMLLFGMKGKLVPKYIEPFEVEKRIGPIAYKLALPLQLAQIHDVFYASLLWKAEVDLSQVLPQFPLEVKEDLTLEVKPMGVLDRSEKELRNRNILMIKVLQRSFHIMEETQKREHEIRRRYPKLFVNLGTGSNFEDEVFIKEGKM